MVTFIYPAQCQSKLTSFYLYLARKCFKYYSLNDLGWKFFNKARRKIAKKLEEDLRCSIA